MIHLQLYEIFVHRNQPVRDEFSKMKDVNYKSFILKDLKSDCRKYDISFYDLVKEIVLDKKIAFQCYWCYLSDFSNEKNKKHNIIGVCKDITFENPKYHDSDILVKIDADDKWHSLFIEYKNENASPKFKVRVYNYVEGLLAQKLEVIKNREKYNI